MTFADLEEKYGGFYAPQFAVSFDGETYGGGVISELTVDAALEKADRFELTLRTEFDRRRGEFVELDWERFAIGTDVEIELGYGRTLEPTFVGSIAELSPEFPENGEPNVRISGYGLRHGMSRGERSESWDETTDAEVASELANRYSFGDVTVADADVVHPKVIQDDESDLAFLERLAERNGTKGGFEVAVRRGEFYFGPVRDEREANVTLDYGAALQSFSPEYTTGSQVAAVEVRGWDPAGKREIVGRAEREGPWSGTEILPKPVRSTAEAEEAAAAKVAEIAAGRLRASGTTVGLPEITPGDVLELGRLGEKFSGPYYVESATHRLGADGYTTSFDVRLPDGEDLE